MPSFGRHDLEQFNTRMAELRALLAPATVVESYVAYTDGACFGNPSGPGGWAAALWSEPSLGWELWGHLSSTSNNRAEALGVLGALEWVPVGSTLSIRSDSELTVRILQVHYKARANPEIWEVIRRTIADKQLALKVEWVRGHAGDPGNELADRLSKLGAVNGRNELLDGPGEAPQPARQQPPELAGLEPRGEWERDFLSSVAKQLRGGRALSPKQQVIVDRIRARASN